MKTTMIFASALVAVFSLTTTIAIAASGHSVEKERGSFASTGVDDDARGEVKLKVKKSSDGRLDLKAQRLDKRATYEVLVDGVLVGTFTTNGGGNGRLRFRSRPVSSHDLLLGFDPRGALIVVRNAAGQDVLAVTLADTGTVSGGDIVCCIPDDSGPECEDRTPEECAAEGGTASTATTCLPNPCAGTAPPTDDVICCIPDDSGPECEDRTADECSAQGGVVVEASSCDPNPCAGTVPPADGDIQCCLADDSGPECEDRTPAECAVEGGVNAGAGTCTPNPCESLPPQPSAATVTVKCETRSDRSRISVDGNDLVAASYQARVTSGANSATAPARPTVGDEVEFDFDSDAGDIAAGATAISPTFIQGGQVTGAIITISGAVVAEATVTCDAN